MFLNWRIQKKAHSEQPRTPSDNEKLRYQLLIKYLWKNQRVRDIQRPDRRRLDAAGRRGGPRIHKTLLTRRRFSLIRDLATVAGRRFLHLAHSRRARKRARARTPRLISFVFTFARRARAENRGAPRGGVTRRKIEFYWPILRVISSSNIMSDKFAEEIALDFYRKSFRVPARINYARDYFRAHPRPAMSAKLTST